MKKEGGGDSWGEPNAEGYFRDDNSLVKGLPRSLPVTSSSNRSYNGRRLGRGFVASHVWRELSESETLASRHPLTYCSCLTWSGCRRKLRRSTGPRRVVRSDVRSGPVDEDLPQADRVSATRGVVDEAWSMLPAPTSIPEQGLPDESQLNFFAPSEQWVTSRIQKIADVSNALDRIAAGEDLTSKVISTRYTAGLPIVSPKARAKLRKDLVRFAADPP